MRNQHIHPLACASLASAFSFIAMVGCAGRGEITMLDPLEARDSGEAASWDAILASRLHRPFDQQRQLRESYADTLDAHQRRTMRDAIVFAALAWIEEHAQRSRIRLATARAAHDAAGDVAVIGLSAAATLAGGEAVKSALSATAAALVGANRAIDVRFLNEQNTAAIITQMETNHLAARAAIEARLRAMDDAAYPLAAADIDLIDCLYAGSPTRALASLADEASLRRATLRRGFHANGPSPDTATAQHSKPP